jgi:rubredoxin
LHARWSQFSAAGATGPLERACRTPPIGYRLSSIRASIVQTAVQPMPIPLLIDRSRSEKLTAQLVDQLREAIRRGRIAPGARDLDLPTSLRAAFGHKDLGIYLKTRKGGKVVIGDAVIVPQTVVVSREALSPPPISAPSDQRRFICRGCYFIYEEAAGLPKLGIAPNTPFSSIPANWRCPDCGTEKTTFRPYVGLPTGVEFPRSK